LNFFETTRADTLNLLPSRPSFFARLALLSLLQVPSAFAADAAGRVLWSSDGGSTMRIEGDTRTLEMQDNVKVTQGALVIKGDEAIFEYNAQTNDLRRVSVFGTPVHYEQQLETGELVTGSSESMFLYRDADGESVLEFRGSAVINSPESSMSCTAIIYLADQELIREATGPCQGTLSSSDN